MRRICLLAALPMVLAATTAHAAVRRLAGVGDPDPAHPGSLVHRSWNPAISPDGFTAFMIDTDALAEAVLYDDDGTIGAPTAVGEMVASGVIEALGDPIALAGTAILIEAAAGGRQVLVAWDASNGAREIFAFDDTLPGGAPGHTVQVVGANTAGQVLLLADDRELALVQPDGSIATVIAMGDAVPGTSGLTVSSVTNAFLAEDGRITVAVSSFVMVFESFLLQGKLGALENAASTMDLDGDQFRELRLLGASPAGQVVYSTTSLFADSSMNRWEVRHGSAGATEVAYSAAGEDTSMAIGSGFSIAPLHMESTYLLADNDELALGTGFTDATGGLVPGVALWHDGAWLVVGAGPGARLSGVNDRGQVLFTSDEGVSRFTPGNAPDQRVETLAAVDGMFEVGPGVTMSCPYVGAAGPNPLLPSLDRDGNAVFEVGWIDEQMSVQRFAMTTRPRGVVDLALVEIVGEATDPLPTERSVQLTATIGNHGSSDAIAKLAIATDADVLLPHANCSTPQPKRLVCTLEQPIAAGTQATLEQWVQLRSEAHGELALTVTVLPLSEVEDDDPSNDSQQLTIDLDRDPDEVGEPPHGQGCTVAPARASGSMWWLALLGLAAARRRACGRANAARAFVPAASTRGRAPRRLSVH
ncbi:MAG: hypothetical protein K1X88_16800 [Nannocystaceae bacterium]|nr:hypothetical protein [Nannocystaceae bacterium]